MIPRHLVWGDRPADSCTHILVMRHHHPHRGNVTRTQSTGHREKHVNQGGWRGRAVEGFEDRVSLNVAEKRVVDGCSKGALI